MIGVTMSFFGDFCALSMVLLAWEMRGFSRKLNCPGVYWIPLGLALLVASPSIGCVWILLCGKIDLKYGVLDDPVGAKLVSLFALLSFAVIWSGLGQVFRLGLWRQAGPKRCTSKECRARVTDLSRSQCPRCGKPYGRMRVYRAMRASPPESVSGGGTA